MTSIKSLIGGKAVSFYLRTPMRYGWDQLNYVSLIREARGLEVSGLKTRIKAAVLADCATQHFAVLLRVLFARNGAAAEIYEAGYDTVEQEIRNRDSGLYRFQPDFIILLQSVWDLRRKYYGSSSKERFVETQSARQLEIISALHEHLQAAVIQGNWVLPYERVAGNFDLRDKKSFYSCVLALNRKLTEFAENASDFFICDFDSLASYVGRKNWLDERMWILAKAFCAYEFLPHAAQGVVDIALSLKGSAVKCVVVDLDNTLWGGLIGDDGLEGIRLGHCEDGEAFEALQHFLLELKRRGILLAVCSKNDPKKARLPFHKHPDMVLKLEDFAVFQANWENKPENLRQIREILNIGYDSMVFLDDNPFERQVVRAAFPELIVPELPEDPALYLRSIAELNLFETSVFSPLDKDRTVLYQDETKRRAEARTFSDPRAYLQSLEMKITIARFDELNLPRVVQLLQRSNQFNLMTQRFNELQCTAFMEDERGFFPFYVRLKDKYGDNGLIAAVVLQLEDDEIRIVEWLMSCRVLARGVEDYMMNYVFAFAAVKGFPRVSGIYRPTAKNQMVQDFYEKFGFEKTGDFSDGGTAWSLRTDVYPPRETFMEFAAAENPKEAAHDPR